jgi:hypothetical protein
VYGALFGVDLDTNAGTIAQECSMIAECFVKVKEERD